MCQYCITAKRVALASIDVTTAHIAAHEPGLTPQEGATVAILAYAELLATLGYTAGAAPQAVLAVLVDAINEIYGAGTVERIAIVPPVSAGDMIH